MRLFALCGLLFVSMVINSCASSKNSLREHKGSYLESVKLNFEAGEAALKAEEYEKALAYFQFVRSRYPFSKFAALSDLRIADAKYMQKKWLEAASAYEVFLRLHPRHEELAYASYRLGSSYFYAIPSDFFLYPEPASREQRSSKEALAAMERFVLEYPHSEYVPDAREKLAKVFSTLAKHNMLIADYYQRRGRYGAALARYLTVDELFFEAEESGEALYKAALIAKEKLKDDDRANEIMERLVEEKSSSPWATKAGDMLKKWQNDTP